MDKVMSTKRTQYWCAICEDEIEDTENDMHNEGYGEVHAGCCPHCAATKLIS